MMRNAYMNGVWGKKPHVFLFYLTFLPMQIDGLTREIKKYGVLTASEASLLSLSVD